MLASLRQFLLVTFGILICLFFAWFVLTEYGESKILQEPMEHPFLLGITSETPAIISYSGDASFPVNTIEGFEAALAKNPKAMLWADVRPASDGTLMLFRETDFALTTDGQGWVDYTTPSEIAKLNAGFQFRDAEGNFPFRKHSIHIPTLVEFLRKFPTQKMILNFLNNRPGLDEKIKEAIDIEKASSRVLIQSPEEGLMRDLRNQKPDWIFGMSRARNTQLKMLASIGLGSLAALSGDIYISEYGIGRGTLQRSGTSSDSNVTPHSTVNIMFSENIRAELLRRKLPFMIGPIQDKSLAESLVHDGASGIITKNVLLLDR